jgi:CBS domain-containing protein
VSGDPGTEISSLVKKHHIDTLVLGNRKMGAIEKFFLGSVSEYCLKHAECSVMIHKKGSHVCFTSSTPPIGSPRVTGKELLSCVTLHECLGPRHKPFTYVESNWNASQILKILTDHSITAVPVRDALHDRWLGFVEMTDIAEYILRVIKEAKTDEDLGQLLARKPLLGIHAAQLFKRESPAKTFKTLSSEDVLKDALELIVEKGFERFGVQDLTGKLIGVVSQTKIISFLSERADVFEFSRKTVSELQLGYREVISVNQHELLKAAIEIILQMNIHGVGVVDDQGKLVGNLSVSDLKIATSDEQLLQMFYLPTKQILAQQKQALIPSPICVQPGTTVEEVIEKFAITRVHRLYVLDEKEELLGVITMSDLMSLLFSVFISK